MKVVATPKKIASFETCQSLLTLIEMGKVRIVKEHTDDGTLLIAVSDRTIGAIGERYKYLFEQVDFRTRKWGRSF